jgi:hypothetical protein
MNSNVGVHLLLRERGFLPKIRLLAAPTTLSKVGLPELAQKNNLEKGRAIGRNVSPCRYCEPNSSMKAETVSTGLQLISNTLWSIDRAGRNEKLGGGVKSDQRPDQINVKDSRRYFN